MSLAFFLALAAQAEDIKVTTDTSVDCTSIPAIARDLFRGKKTDDEKAVAAWSFVRRQCFHWPLIPTNDSLELINSYGFGLCGNQSNMLCEILEAGGIESRIIYAPSHVLMEAFYDGGWHLFDCQVGWFARKKDKSTVASAAEMRADPSIVLDAVKDGRASRPFFQCGDDPRGAGEWMEKHTIGGRPRVPRRSLVINLRRGESITRTWSPDGRPWAPPDEKTWVSPHHGCGRQTVDADDPANWPFWKPYAAARQPGVYGIKRTYANGRMVYAPDLASRGFEEDLGKDGFRGVRRKTPGRAAPNLHPTEPGKAGSVVVQVDVPYVIVDAWLEGEFVRRSPGDTCRVLASPDGQDWTQVWNADSSGTLKPGGVSLKGVARDRHRYFVKLEFQASGEPEAAGVNSLTVTSVFVNNPQALPHFVPGKNEIRLNAKTLKDRRVNLRYVWEEEGREKIHEARITSSPFTAAISVQGAELPRMKSLSLAVDP